MTEKRKITVAPLMPTRGHPNFQATHSLTAASIMASKAGIEMFHVRHRTSSAVHENRNAMIADLITDCVQNKLNFTHILFQDDDIAIPKETIVKLVEADKGIVGALCTTRSNPPIPNARVWHEDTGLWENCLEYKHGLTKFGAVGTGVMLIDYEQVIKPMAMIYLDCLYERDVMGMPESKAAEWSKVRKEAFNEYPNAWWFRWLPPLDGNGENSEDVFFCWSAKRYFDIQTWVDTSVQPGHFGEIAVSIADYELQREALLESAKAEGRYTPATKTKPASVTPKIFVAMKKAAMGEFPVEPIEQPKSETSRISVILPTRGRGELLLDTIASLLSKAKGDIEILVRRDDDEWPAVYAPKHPNVIDITGPRHAYRGLHLYYNELAEKATGDWILCWSDDAIMETQDWDEKIHQHGGGLKILRPFSRTHPQLNLFPVVSRSLYETLGHISLQAHGDSWLQVVGRLNGIEYPVDITVKHLRDEGLDDQTKKESLETYKTSSPEFFSPVVQEKLRRDVKKVHKAVERMQKQNLKAQFAAD